MLAVPRKVLKDRFEEQPEKDELAAAEIGDSIDENEDLDSYDTDEFFRESAPFSPSPNVDGNPHDKNLTKDVAQRTTPKPPPYAKAKGGGTGNRELVACMLLAIASACSLCKACHHNRLTNSKTSINSYCTLIATRTKFRMIKGEPRSNDSTVLNRSVVKSKLNLPEPITSHSNDSKLRWVLPSLPECLLSF